MSQLDLIFFDLENLIGNINSSLAEGETPLQLGNYTVKTPKKRTFIESFFDATALTSGKFGIYQPHDIALLHPFNQDGKLGYIFVETGEMDVSSDYGGNYESLRLRIKRPLALKGRIVIPNCSIKLCHEYGDELDPIVDRRDHQRYVGFQKRTDLTKKVPSEWFYKSKPQ